MSTLAEPLSQPGETSYFSANSVGRYICQLYESAGFKASRMYRECGVDPHVFDDTNGRFPHHVTSRVWEKIESHSRDRHIGLHLGNHAEFVPTNLVYHIMRASQSLGDSLGKCVKYQRLLSDAANVRLDVHGGRAEFVFNLRHSGVPPTRHQMEFWLANIVGHLSDLTGKKFRASEIRFQHEAPHLRQEYDHVFSCKVKFGARNNSVLIPVEQLVVPVVCANDEVSQLLCGRANALLGLLQQESMTLKVRRALCLELEVSDCLSPNIQRVSKRLALSPRTMQRRLAEDGTTFANLVDDVRKGFALASIGDTDEPIAEVGYRLGYSEISCFYRAFKRWTGVTPGSFRLAKKPR